MTRKQFWCRGRKKLSIKEFSSLGEMAPWQAPPKKTNQARHSLARVLPDLAGTFGKGFVRHYHLKQKIALRHEIQAFELRNAEIRRQIEHYRSYEYIERVAREELGLVKPGNKVYNLRIKG